MEKTSELKLSRFDRWRIRWAGADTDVLKKCPSEIPKYIGYGNTILLTAVLASLSGGFAIYSIFENNIFQNYIPFLFGPVWGYVIFNLDCAVLRGMRKPFIPSKEETIKLIDEEDTNVIRKTIKASAKRRELLIDQWGLFLVRLLIALVIGFIISKPLEVQMFNNRILEKDADNKKEDLNKFFTEDSARNSHYTIRRDVQSEQTKVSIAEVYNDPLLNNLRNEDSSLSAQISTLSKERAYWAKIAQQTKSEVDSNRNVKQVPTKNARDASKRIAGINRDIKSLNDDLELNRSKTNKIEEKLAQDVNNIRKADSATIEIINTEAEEEKKDRVRADSIKRQFERPDLLKRIEILGTLKKGDSSIWWASTMITLIFVIIEIAPVTIKFLTKRGLYDEMLELDEQSRIVDEKNVVSKKFEGISTHLAIRKAKNEKREKNEIEVNNETMDEIAKFQKTMVREVMEKYTKDEIEQLKKGKNFFKND